MADVAVVFHWPPAAMEAMALSDLMGWRDHAARRSRSRNPNETLMADRNLRLQVILEGLDRLTSPLRSITGASAAARQDLARTHEQLKALDAQQQQVGRYKAAETRYADDARQYEALQARLAALRQQLDATEAPRRSCGPSSKVERQTGQTAQRLEQGGAALQKLSAGLSAAGIDVLDLARHEERLATQTQEANATLRQQTAQLDKVNAARRASEDGRDQFEGHRHGPRPSPPARPPPRRWWWRSRR
jgi:chromosome segregation ATPase